MKKLLMLAGIWSLLLLTGCGNQQVVENPIAQGDTVSINYSVSLENGRAIVTDKAETFVVWEGQTLTILEKEVLWMKKGETKTVTATPADAYGKNYDPNKVQKIASTIFETLSLKPEIGKTYTLGTTEGLVKDIVSSIVLFDTNAPETYNNVNIVFTIK